MPRKEEDSLGQDFTRTGEPESPKPPESQRSLGDQSTHGDAGSSVSDVGGLDDAFESDMEVVDLSDRYEIEGVIGKGGMGEVLRARDKRLNRPVAIKRILGQMARSKNALARFLTEAQSVAKLNHFNIVQIYDYGRAADGPFIIMELVEGHSLQDKLNEGPLDLQIALEMTCQLCDALSTAHEAGIIHRDIKPANILLTQRGEPKLTDFGLARQDTADHGQTMAGAVLGTIDFMPPEQRQDATLTDARSDLWALAATLYQMVTGRSPKVIRLDVVNESLRPVMGQALKENPEDRYQTVADFRDDLRASFTGRQSEAAANLELGAGECPKCHTKNEASRKFCSKCAESLQMNCLQCEGKIRVWDTVCGECGAKQNELAEARHAEMASRQKQAEKLLKQYDYEAAIRVATGLRGEPDSRFHQLKEWAEQFLQDVEQQRKQQLARIADLVQEALQHEKAYDYQAGINTLEQIPETLREQAVHGQSFSASKLLFRLQEKLEESLRLNRQIRQGVKTRKLAGLLDDVEALLKLQPNRQSLLKLRGQLVERDRKLRDRRETAYTAAEGLFASQDYNRCLVELAKIDSSILTPEIISLRHQATIKRDRVKTLRSVIKRAVKENRLHDLLDPVQECLELRNGDGEMEKLRDQLMDQQKTNTDQIAKAVALRHECRFEAAAELVKQIPKKFMTREANDLLRECTICADLRSAALQALATASRTGKHEEGLRRADKYRTTLKTHGLVDQDFLDKFELCRTAFAKAERRRALRNKVAIAAALITLFLVIVAGFWIRSSMRAHAIAEGIRLRAWDKVLTLDPQNVTALIGRATDRLNRLPPEIDTALSDLKLAEQFDPSATGLQEARAAAQKARTERLIAEREAQERRAEEKAVAEREAQQRRAAEPAAATNSSEKQIAAESKSQNNDSTVFIPSGSKVEFGQQKIITPVIAQFSWRGIGADVDDDGDTDVLSINTPKISWHNNDGEEHFTETLIATPEVDVEPSSISTCDMDSDGDTDILVGFNGRKLAWYENNGDGSFSEKALNIGGSPLRRCNSAVAVDLDGDNDLDVLKGGMHADQIAWYENDGHQQFTENLVGDYPNDVVTVCAADVDGDGYMDIVASVYHQGKIIWHRNDGQQKFTEHLVASDSNGVYRVVAADVDRDGDIDVLAASVIDRKIAWHDNDGSENFQERIISTDLPEGSHARWFQAADMDGDGDTDVLSPTSRNGKPAWHENDGAGNFTEHVIRHSENNTYCVFASDIDSDGDLDVLTFPGGAGNIAWYENQFLASSSNAGRAGDLAEITPPQSNLNKGLVAYYPFNGTANDESGNDNHGTIHGPSLGTDRHGVVAQAYKFDGVDDYIEVKDHPTLRPTAAITVSVWCNWEFRPDRDGERILSKNSPIPQKGPGAYQIITGTNDEKDTYGEIGFYITTTERTHSFGRTQKFDDSDTYLPHSEWHHVTGTWDGNTGKVFHDGVLVYQAQRGGTLRHTPDPLFFGKDQELGLYFKGAIDDIRIYNRALSTAEVEALYDMEHTPPRKIIGPQTSLPRNTSTPPPAIAPFDNKQATSHQKAWADSLGTSVEITNSIGMKLKLIPAGEFTMGSPESEPGRFDNETQHQVQITKPFYLSAHEVTQQQYQQVMDKNPSKSKGDNKPVTGVSWNDAVSFCRKLSEQEDREYRLPTEAQWEYACRAGTTTAYSFGNDASQLGQYAWYFNNAKDIGEKYAHRVGKKLPNPWGMYDMHGNVSEWCQDWYGAYETKKVLVDSTGPASGNSRMLRGGSFPARPRYIRSALRVYYQPDDRDHSHGFRLARTYNLSP